MRIAVVFSSQVKQYSRKRVTEVDPKKCYVGNLPDDVQDDEFAQHLDGKYTGHIVWIMQFRLQANVQMP